MTTFDKVREIISGQLSIDAEDITEDANLVDDLGADSLDIVELVMAIEDGFSITIADEVTESMKTVSDIVKYIEAL